MVKALDAKDWPRAAHAAVDLREFLSQQGFDLAGAQIASGVLTASALHITPAVKGRDQAALAETYLPQSAVGSCKRKAMPKRNARAERGSMAPS